MTPSFDRSESTQDYTPGDAPTVEAPGDVFAGRFKLREKLGEGGMGRVYVADQLEPVQRRVAVKVLKTGLGAAGALARFEQERQALALMDHPNIAKVFDGGTDERGRPFLAMELVKGISITTYCDREKLTVPERLELFVAVCQAVQHAHQKGVIHRDLKPSNILVALYDGKPVPKVIDFGVAKATTQRLVGETIYTEVGTLVGTLEYMAPEQAELNNLDIDTRADIYSLGVILYELLTGSPPFTSRQLRGAPLSEVLRLLREVEPPRPSTRLSGSDELPDIASRRKLEPRRLTRLVHGDLDRVVMKCLEKERGRRYETANGLAMDLERYLHDEPVLAGAPGAGYRLRKFVRRNKGAVTAAVLVLLALLGGIAGTSYGLFRAERQRGEAEQARGEAERQAARADRNLAAARKAVDDTLTAVAEDPQLKAGKSQKLRKELLGKAVPFFEEFVRQHSDDPQLEAERARAYGRLGFVRTEMGEVNEADAAYARMAEVFAHLAEAHPSRPEYRLGLAQAHNGRSGVLSAQKPKEAEAASRAAVAVCRALADEFPTVPEYRAELATGYANLGGALSFQGRYADAEAELRRGVQTLQELVAAGPGVPRLLHDLSRAQARLGLALTGQGKLDEGEAAYRRSVELAEKLVATDPGARAYQAALQDTLFRLAGVLQTRGKPTEAARILGRAREGMEAMAADFPAVPEYRRRLALFHRQMAEIEAARGRTARAAEEYRQAVALFAKLAEDFPAVHNYRSLAAIHRTELANVLLRQGKAAEAEGQCRRALETFDKLAAEAPGNVDTSTNSAWCHEMLGEVRDREGRHTEAEAQFRQALAIVDKLTGAANALPEVQAEKAMLRADLALCLADRGRTTEAEQEYRRAFEGCEKLAADLPDQAEYLDSLARLRATCAVDRLRDPARAVQLARRAVGLSPESPDYHNTLGVALYRSGDWEAAAAALGTGLKLRDADDPGADTARLFLAMVRWRQGKADEARQLHTAARAALVRRGPSPEERRFLAEAAALFGEPAAVKP
jgi:tetratricopeptide (TPR) repeat protein